jgi:regulator of sigma D
MIFNLKSPGNAFPPLIPDARMIHHQECTADDGMSSSVIRDAKIIFVEELESFCQHYIDYLGRNHSELKNVRGVGYRGLKRVPKMNRS